MTKEELKSLGLTAAEYEAAFGEAPDASDATIAEATAEAPVEAVAEAPKAKKTKKAKKVAATEAPATESVVDAIVPAEAKAEVVATGEAMSFKNMKAAAEYMAEKLNLKVSNTLDGLYKTIRRGTNKTHGFAVVRNEDNTVVLTPIA